jgi:hypothetical protein
MPKRDDQRAGIAAPGVQRDHPDLGYDTDSLIQVLGELRRFLGGEKATLPY